MFPCWQVSEEISFPGINVTDSITWVVSAGVIFLFPSPNRDWKGSEVLDLVVWKYGVFRKEKEDKMQESNPRQNKHSVI